MKDNVARPGRSGYGGGELDPAREAPTVEGVSAVEHLETVGGVPLEQGERVVLFALPNHRVAKIVHIVLGVLLIPLLVGIPLLIYGILYERWQLQFVALTDRRVITKKGETGVHWLRLDD